MKLVQRLLVVGALSLSVAAQPAPHPQDQIQVLLDRLVQTRDAMQSVGEQFQAGIGLYRFIGGYENRRAYWQLYQHMLGLDARWEQSQQAYIDDCRALVAELRRQQILLAEADGLEKRALQVEQERQATTPIRQMQNVLGALARGNITEMLRHSRELESQVSPELARSMQGTQIVYSIKSLRPEWAQQALARYQAVSAEEKAMAESAEQALLPLRNQTPVAADFLARHHRVWPVLTAIPLENESNFSDWSLAFWPAECGRILYRLSANDPQRQALRQTLERDLAEMDRSSSLRFGVTPLRGKQLNPDWSLWRWSSQMDLLLTLAGHATRAGQFDEAQLYLDRFRTQALPELDRLPSRLLDAGELVLKPRGVQMDFRDGLPARLRGRWHEMTARVSLARSQGKLSPETLQHLEQSYTLYGKALSPQSSLWVAADLAVARWLSGSAAEAQSLVAAALKEAQGLQHRACEIRLLLAQARIGLKFQPALMESALAAFEGYVREIGPATEVADDLWLFAKQAYQEYAQSRADAGLPEQSLQTLARMQQMESLNGLCPTLPQLAPVQAELRSLEQEAVALRQLPEANNANQQAQQQNAQLLASKRGEFYTLMSKIRQQNPDFEASLAIRPVNFSEVQPQLPEDCAVVQFFPGDQTLYFFTVTQKSLKIRSLPLARARLDQWIDNYRALLSAPNSNAGELQKLSEQLYTSLIGPVEEDLQGKSVVAFVPSGRLFYLPLGTLCKPQGKPLLDSYQVAVLAKSNDLERLTRRPVGSGSSLLAFANPDGSLPASATEVAAIGKLFPESELLVAGKARKQRLLTAKESPAYLHFATHGRLNGSDPSQSYLVLAGASEDARLTAAEIADLDLAGKTRLVTLSACQTALGSGNPGSEVTSLADAFRWAGSPTLVASLWKVSDEATQHLMVDFYAGLKAGQAPGEALRQAQLKLRVRPGFSHPFFWSPFVLTGDWR